MPNLTSESADRSAAFLAELAGLVRLAAGRPRLQLVAGQPGCGWSFNWRSERVTVDPDDIRQLAPDLCRGLALHEAAHAAITVVQQFVQAQVLQRLLPLINAIEDLRIENWMQRHFPGATLWIRAYNEVFSSLADSHQLPPSRQAQFLQALLDRWWLGSLRPGTLPEVMQALQEVREPLAEAIACLPPPAADASKILASQQAMWAIVGRQIVPVWERLVAADSAAGIPRLAACQEERTGSESPPSEPRSRTGCDASAADCDAAHRRPTVTTTTASPRSAAADRRQLRKRLTAALGPGGDDCYQAARRKVATLIDRVGDELLRLLRPRQRLRWQTGLPSGPQLELRRAMQFAADPQAHRSLWSRPQLPRRSDPAVLLLLDRSGSMQRGGLIERAFEAAVLLLEVCHRIGVPVAVWSFAEDCRQELGWDAALSPRTQQTLSRLPNTCRGGTEMAEAIAQAGRELQKRTADPRLLFVLSDGEPNDPAATTAAVASLTPIGITTIGLGLGPLTAGLTRIFPQAATGIVPADLPACLGRLLAERLLIT